MCFIHGRRRSGGQGGYPTNPQCIALRVTQINGLHRACTDAPTRFGITASLILCFLRHLSEEEAFACLEQVTPHRDKIVGIGLASSEVGHPPEKFARVFARARQLGFRLVAHAGE